MQAMDTKIRGRYDSRAKVLKAMAHPTRLFIIDQLSMNKRCVCELTEMLGVDASTVSKHLSVLKNAGIVSDEKVGTKIYYQLQCFCFKSLFECIETVVKSSAEAQLKFME